VGPLEAAHLRAALASDPARAEKLRALEASNPHRNRRCAFLEAAGGCGIYELRPIVCRSHGAPLQFRAENEETRFRDACALNFTSTSLADLPATDIMNLDTLNTLLALLTRAHGGHPTERTPLKPTALCPK
jgi:Fe-S-cluster containining protein